MKIDVEKITKTAEIVEGIGKLITVTTKSVTNVKDFVNNINDANVKDRKQVKQQQKENMKIEKELNNDIGNIIYNELLERFYENKEIRDIVVKDKFNKNDALMIAAGIIIPGAPMIVGFKALKMIFDNNLDIDEYYKKFIQICDNQGLRDKLADNDNYVPNDEELINLMMVYKRKTNIDLIEILHCKYGHLNIKYK